MSLSEKYLKSMDLKWSLRFKTAHPEGDSYDGVVTHIKRNFIVLRGRNEFDFDGVIVLAKKMLKGYRDGNVEECHNRIFRHNGNIKKARSPRWVGNCSSIADVLKQLHKRGIWPMVELIYEEDGKAGSEFFIGEIMRVEGDVFWIRDYDAAGCWNGEYKIKMSEVFRIEFDSAYSNRFNDYMRSLSTGE
jgi:hypothetical protein